MLFISNKLPLLLLLPAVIFLTVCWYRYSRKEGHPTKGWFIAVSISIVVLIAAMSEPAWIKRYNTDSRVYLIDVSDSISDVQLQDYCDKIISEVDSSDYKGSVSYYAFADDIIPISKDSINSLQADRQHFNGVFNDQIQTDFFAKTDIESSLVTILKDQKIQTEIKIFSDCLENSGNSLPILKEMARIGFTYSFIEPLKSTEAEVLIKKVYWGGPVRAGQSANLIINIESNISAGASIRIDYIDGYLDSVFDIALSPGENTKTVEVMVPDDEYIKGQVCIEAENDSIDSNNSYFFCAHIEPRGKVSVICEDAEIITKMGVLFTDYKVKQYDPMSGFDEADLLVIFGADGVNSISSDRWPDIVKAVSGGMGLLCLPDEKIITSRHDNLEILNDLLPVSIITDSKGDNPDTAVVFVVDTSGSMGNELVSIAREVVNQSIKRLGKNDLVGIVEFYGKRKWVVNLQSSSNQFAINRALSKLTHGGGTVVLPAIQEAHYTLLNADCSIKHIILITDGAVEQGDYKDVVQNIAQDGITFSTILTGNSLHVSFLTQLARFGNGSFFNVSDKLFMPGLNLKEIFIKPGRVESSYINSYNPVNSYELLSRVDYENLPVPDEFIKTSLKNGAQGVLNINGNWPLLSFWHYGRGKVAFWAGDNSGLLFSDRNMTQLSLALTRTLCKDSKADLLIWQNIINDSVIYDKNIDLRYPGEQNIKLHFTGPEFSCIKELSGSSYMTIPDIKVVKSGFYNGSLEVDGNVVSTTEFAVNIPPETSSLHFDSIFTDIANSYLYKDSKDEPQYTAIELWPYLVFMSLLAFVANVFVRRLPGAIAKSMLLLALFLCFNMADTLSAANGSDSVLTDNNSQVSINVSAGELYSFFIGGDSGKANQTSDIQSPVLNGYSQFLEHDYEQAMETFYYAAINADYKEDIEYLLALSILSSQKAGKENEIVDSIIKDERLISAGLDPLLFFAGYMKRAELLPLLQEQVTADSALTAKERELFSRRLSDLKFTLNASSDELIYDDNTQVDIVLAAIKSYLRSGNDVKVSQLLDSLKISGITGDRLFLLIEGLIDLGCYESALHILNEISDRPGNEFKVLMYIVRIYNKQNNQEKAKSILLEMSESNNFENQQKMLLVAELEKAGCYSQCKAILQSLYKETKAEDVLFKLAELQYDITETSELYRLWLDVWCNCSDRSRLFILEPRLLDTAVRSDTLAELVVFLEKRINSGIELQKSINLLVSIYEKIGDSITVVEIINEYYGTDTVESLKLKNRLYYRSGFYGYCLRTLTKLIEFDPENKTNYLYQIALLSLENNTPALSHAAINELENLPEKDDDTVVFIAGIYNILGEYERAFSSYSELINRMANNYDLWFSWAESALNADRAEDVISVLSRNINAETPEQLFCISTDLLMAINPERTLLNKAKEELLRRISISPDNSVLYSLASNMLESNGDESLLIRLKLSAALYMPHQRITHLRDIISISGNSIVKNDIALLLIMTGSRLPAESLVQMAKRLLNEQQYEMANYIVKNYIVSPENIEGVTELIEYYNNQGLYDYSLDLISEYLIFRPNDLNLLQAKAEVYEIMGVFAKAFDTYFYVYKQFEKQAFYDFQVNGQIYIKNINEKARYRFIVLEAMIDCGDDIQIKNLKTYIAKNIEELKGITGSLARKKFLSAWFDYDRLLLSLGDINESVRLFNLYRNIAEIDNGFMYYLAQSRIEFGFLSSEVIGLCKVDSKFYLELLQNNKYNLPGSPDSIIAEIKSYIRVNDYSKAENVLASLADVQINNEDIFNDIVSAAAICKDYKKISDFAVNYIDNYILKQSDSEQITLLRDVFALISKLLTPDQLNSIIDYIRDSYSENMNVEHLCQIYSSQPADGIYYPSHLVEDVINSYSRKRDYYYEVIEIIKNATPETRSDALSYALAILEPEKRALFMLYFIGKLNYVVTGEELSGYLNSINELQEFKLVNNAQYQLMARMSSVSRHNPALVKAMANRALEIEPHNLEFLSFMYMVSSLSTDSIFDNSTTQELLDKLFSCDEVKPWYIYAVVDAISCIPEDSISDYFVRYHDLYDEPGPAQLLLMSELLYRQDNYTEMKQYLIECYKLDSLNNSLYEHIYSRFVETGDLNLLSDTLQSSLQNEAFNNKYLWKALFKNACHTGDRTLAENALKHESTILHTLDSLFLATLFNDYEMAGRFFRKSITQSRNYNRLINFKWVKWLETGGINQLSKQIQNDINYKMYQVLAQYDSLNEDYHRYRRYMNRIGISDNDLVVLTGDRDNNSALKLADSENKLPDIFWQTMKTALYGYKSYDYMFYENLVYLSHSTAVTKQQKNFIADIVLNDKVYSFDTDYYNNRLRALNCMEHSHAGIIAAQLENKLYLSISNNTANELLKYYLSVDDWESFERILSHLIENNNLSIADSLPADILELDRVGSENLLEFVDKSIKYILSVNSKRSLDGTCCKYLAMFAVLKHKAGSDSRAVLETVSKLAINSKELTLWYMDALNLCGYTQQADEIYQSLHDNGDLSYDRIKNYKYN